jgi:hypothetical protein
MLQQVRRHLPTRTSVRRRAFGLFAAPLLLGATITEAAPTRTAVCVLGDIAVHASRVHLRCDYNATQINVPGVLAMQPMNKSSNHPPFFAVSINSPMAAPLVALATPMTKQSLGQEIARGDWAETHVSPGHNQSRGGFSVRGLGTFQFLVVVYDAGDLSGANFGCNTNDCRIPTSVFKVYYPGGQGD